MSKIDVFLQQVLLDERLKNRVVITHREEARIDGTCAAKNGVFDWWVVLRDNRLWVSSEAKEEVLQLVSMDAFVEFLKTAASYKRVSEKPAKCLDMALIHIQHKYQSQWFVLPVSDTNYAALVKCRGYLVGGKENPKVSFVESWTKAFGNRFKVELPYTGSVQRVVSIRME
jgi:hypothetical protein